MNRTAAEKAAREIVETGRYQMLTEQCVADIIERACGQTEADELLDLESSIAAFAGKAHAVIQRAREQMSDEEVEIADRNAAEILAQCARGREDDSFESERHRTSNPINEGSNPSGHSKLVEDCWHVWNDNRIKRADNWTEACLQFAEYFRERACGQDGHGHDRRDCQLCLSACTCDCEGEYPKCPLREHEPFPHQPNRPLDELAKQVGTALVEMSLIPGERLDDSVDKSHAIVDRVIKLRRRAERAEAKLRKRSCGETASR